MAVFAAPETISVRPAVKAGTWYPLDAKALIEMIDGLLGQPSTDGDKSMATIHGVIVPHAAYPYSGATAAAAYSMLKGRNYERVILLGPAHSAGHQQGLFILNVDAYETPLGPIPLDHAAIVGLRKSPVVHEEPLLHRNEHSLEIQLPFLQRILKPGWRLVPILVGDMQQSDYPQAANILRPLLDETTLLIISTDFTHYGPRFRYLPFPLDYRTAERIHRLDMGAFSRIAAKDPEGFLRYRNDTGITACGYRAVTLLLHLLPSDVKVRLLQSTTSGELTGDYSHSVSYIAAVVIGREK